MTVYLDSGIGFDSGMLFSKKQIRAGNFFIQNYKFLILVSVVRSGVFENQKIIK